MAVLNFPPTAGQPTDGSYTYEENGIIYSWDGEKWTAQETGWNEVFLSKVNDDTANGEITFEDTTTHKNGLSVTGGDISTIPTGVFSDSVRGIYLTHDSQSVFAAGFGLTQTCALVKGSTAGGAGAGDNSVKQGFLVSAKFSGTMGNGLGIVSDCDVSNVAASNYSFYAASLSSGSPDAGKAFGSSYCYNTGSLTDIGRNKAYGFYSQYNENTDKNWNFYADGNAPNFFRGEVEVKAKATGTNAFAKFENYNGNIIKLILSKEGAVNAQNALEVKAGNAIVWSVNYNGTASFSSMSGALRDVQLEMDADDPAAFTTTFALEQDADGNEIQVENTVYSGTTESLLEIIRDLRSRIATLEADHATMMNNNGGSY